MSSIRPIRSAAVLGLRAPMSVGEARFGLGTQAVDERLGGGLTAAALHDLYAAAPDDTTAAAAFALLLTLAVTRQGSVHGPTLWVRARRAERTAGTLHAHGIAELGGDPDAVLLVMPDDDRGVLRAADDGVRHGSARAIVVELHGTAALYDLTASRRLALAARARGVLVLCLRVGGMPMPSAAETRWSIAAAPSLPLAANAPGQPTFDLTLLRHRGGLPGFDARLEWNRDTRSFASVPCPAPAAAVVRTSAAARAA